MVTCRCLSFFNCVFQSVVYRLSSFESNNKMSIRKNLPVKSRESEIFDVPKSEEEWLVSEQEDNTSITSKTIDEIPSTGDRMLITQGMLDRVHRQLGLIELCWPKINGNKENVYFNNLPESYSVVSNKEKLLLWYAENFRKQYHMVYKDRKPLLLACKNECDVQVGIFFANSRFFVIKN